jgi:hypothetical protein
MINNEIKILLLITSPLSTTTPSLATISFPSSTIPSSSVTDSSSSSTASFLSPSISPSLASISSPSLLPIEVNPINKKKNLKSRSKYSIQYLSNWKKQSEAQYKTRF